MKNSPMPPRKEPMSRGKPMQPGGPIARKTPMPVRKVPPRSGPPTPCPPKRSKPLPVSRPEVTPEEKAAREIVTIRASELTGARLCEGCGCAPGQQWSHRIGRGVGGPWCAANGMSLCWRCHAYIGAEPAKARSERGWRLTSTDDHLAVPALLFGRGWVLLHPDGSVTPTEARPPVD